MAPAAPLTVRDLNRATLARQGLLAPMRADSVRVAVERLGSLQAQHPEWPPVALASRSADPAITDLATGLARREVVRASLMRITIHVVTAADLWPMFTVCQPMRLAQWRLLTKSDPIDSALGKRMLAAHGVALAALADGPVSSTELDRLMSAELGPIDSPIPRIRWRHLSALVPLVHVPFDGERYGRSRYAVASEWLGRDQPVLDDADARVHVTRRYLAAFGPASLDDLAAYVRRSGITGWRTAIASLRDEVITLHADDGRMLYDLADAPRPPADADAPPRLLVRWDSLLLSHATKTRDRIIAPEHRASVFSKNADVLPTFTVDGFVAGTWQLTRSEGAARIALHPFDALPKRTREPLIVEAERVLALIAADAERSVRVGA
ncbi:MAG: winged helix DNA-binding domain-containing protein [Candidatus Limnocylindria bacterium]